FADVSQFINVLNSARSLEDQRLEAGRNRSGELTAQSDRARDHFLRVGNISGGDFVKHVRRVVAEHALGADIKDLDDAAFVGGDAGKVGAVENCGLQSARFKQNL